MDRWVERRWIDGLIGRRVHDEHCSRSASERRDATGSGGLSRADRRGITQRRGLEPRAGAVGRGVGGRGLRGENGKQKEEAGRRGGHESLRGRRLPRLS